MKNLKSFFETPAKAVVSIIVIVAVLALAGAAGAAVARNSFTEERKEPSAAVSDEGAKDKEAHADGQKNEAQAGQENAEQTGQAADNAVPNISEEKAKSIAVSHAGFSEADVRFTESKLDQEDGVEVYEIEFHKDGMEYDYEINAATGDIIEYSSDRDDDRIKE